MIIDTDPGIDDAMAIFYAVANPAIDILGLTTVFGNVRTSHVMSTIKNKILHSSPTIVATSFLYMVIQPTPLERTVACN